MVVWDSPQKGIPILTAFLIVPLIVTIDIKDWFFSIPIHPSLSWFLALFQDCQIILYTSLERTKILYFREVIKTSHHFERDDVTLICLRLRWFLLLWLKTFLTTKILLYRLSEKPKWKWSQTLWQSKHLSENCYWYWLKKNSGLF